MLERDYQRELVERIKKRIPGCEIDRNDPNRVQGHPDLTVRLGIKWAWLEVKASEKSKERPNQRYYIENCDGVYAAFIYPENEEEILRELEQALQS